MTRFICLLLLLNASGAVHGDGVFYLVGVSDEVLKLERLVLRGSHEAEYELAERLSWSRGVRGNFDRALRLYGRACRGGIWEGCSMHARELMQNKQYNKAESILLKTFQEQPAWVYASQLARLYEEEDWAGFSRWKSIKYKALAVSLRAESMGR